MILEHQPHSYQPCRPAWSLRSAWARAADSIPSFPRSSSANPAPAKHEPPGPGPPPGSSWRSPVIPQLRQRITRSRARAALALGRFRSGWLACECRRDLGRPAGPAGCGRRGPRRRRSGRHPDRSGHPVSRCFCRGERCRLRGPPGGRRDRSSRSRSARCRVGFARRGGAR